MGRCVRGHAGHSRGRHQQAKPGDQRAAAKATRGWDCISAIRPGWGHASCFRSQQVGVSVPITTIRAARQRDKRTHPLQECTHCVMLPSRDGPCQIRLPQRRARLAGCPQGMISSIRHASCMRHIRLPDPFRPRHGVGAHVAHDLKLPRRCSPSTGNRMAYPSIRRPAPAIRPDGTSPVMTEDGLDTTRTPLRTCDDTMPDRGRPLRAASGRHAWPVRPRGALWCTFRVRSRYF